MVTELWSFKDLISLFPFCCVTLKGNFGKNDRKRLRVKNMMLGAGCGRPPKEGGNYPMHPNQFSVNFFFFFFYEWEHRRAHCASPRVCIP